MITRLFLAAVGAVYVALAAWCSFSPEHTSKVVGFRLEGGSGQSEFLVVYGGLEFALGLLFLLPLVQPQQTPFALLTCVVLHGCLVLFRSVSFLLFANIGSMTRQLAVYEWLIFLAAAALMFAGSRRS